MKISKTKIIVIVLALIVMAVSAAVYLPQKCMYKKHFARDKGQIFRELNLTPEQRRKLEDNRIVQHRQADQLHETMKAKQAQLREALKAADATRYSVEPLVNEIKSLQAQSIELRVDSIFAVKKILTPQQYASFQQIMDRQKDQKSMQRKIPNFRRRNTRIDK